MIYFQRLFLKEKILDYAYSTFVYKSLNNIINYIKQHDLLLWNDNIYHYDSREVFFYLCF